MRKSLINSAVFVMLLVVIVVSLAFSGSGLSGVKCDAISVEIKDGSPRFLDEEEITNIINKYDEKLSEKKLSAINTDQIETFLGKNASVKNAEVFRIITGTELNFKGKIVAEIEQRRPIVRIMSGTHDYYLDSEGVKIPKNSKFTAKVVIVNGTVSEKFAKEKILPMARFIDENEFWNAMIGQVYVKQNGELILVPLVGDQLIEFGEPDRVQEKFRNLKALYKQIFAEAGWEKYKSINLKYKNQVVCTKK